MAGADPTAAAVRLVLLLLLPSEVAVPLCKWLHLETARATSGERIERCLDREEESSSSWSVMGLWYVGAGTGRSVTRSIEPTRLTSCLSGVCGVSLIGFNASLCRRDADEEEV